MSPSLTSGIIRFPPDCAEKYRHGSGGWPVLAMLLELGASDRVIDMRGQGGGEEKKESRLQVRACGGKRL